MDGWNFVDFLVSTKLPFIVHVDFSIGARFLILFYFIFSRLHGYGMLTVCLQLKNICIDSPSTSKLYVPFGEEKFSCEHILKINRKTTICNRTQQQPNI